MQEQQCTEPAPEASVAEQQAEAASEQPAVEQTAAPVEKAKRGRKPKIEHEPKQVPAGTGKVVATCNVTHGRGTERFEFKAGDELKGLSDQEVQYFLEQGLAARV